MEFQTFDADYVRRLKSGDPATEAHFSTYFEKFLSMKLRSRQVESSFAEDVRQETLFRVLKSLRGGAGVSQPERFGAFVNSVCNNVLLEFSRKHTDAGNSGDGVPELADERVDVQLALITAERKRAVATVLDELPAKDREILRLVFFEEADRERISRELNVETDYLRVLLHRAKARFQSIYVRRHGISTHVLLFFVTLGP